MKNSLCLFLSLLVIFVGCKEDPETPITSPTTFSPQPVSVLADLVGTVVDEHGEALEGVEIKMGNETYFTDVYGLFMVKNETLYGTGTFITAYKDGYFPGSRKFYPEADSRNFVKIEMLSKDLTASFSSSTGGEVSTTDGAIVRFPVNSIVREDGSAYNGTVNAYVKWLDPTAFSTANQMPGAMEGIDEEENAVVLSSFGMIAVELNAPSGEALNVSSAAPATIDLPVPADLLANAPATIPLWYFDDLVGAWVEEGEAVLQNGRYIGLVNHFSFWNCNVPFPLVDFKVTFTQNGMPITNAMVKITILSSSWFRLGFTDNAGTVVGKVAKNELMLMELFIANQCVGSVYSQQIGPFSSNVNLGVINLVLPSINLFNLTGSLEDCNQNPVSNGMAVIEFMDGSAYAFADANGDFSFTQYICGSSSIDVYGVNFDDYTTSTTEVFPINTTIDAGTIDVCGDTINEYIIIDIDGSERVYVDIIGVLDSGSNSLTFKHDWVDLNDTVVCTFYVINFSGTGTYTDDDLFLVYRDINYSPIYSNSCEDCGFVQFEITEFGDIGEEVKGFFSGDIIFYEDWQTTVFKPVTGSFSFIRESGF